MFFENFKKENKMNLKDVAILAKVSIFSTLIVSIIITVMCIHLPELKEIIAPFFFWSLFSFFTTMILVLILVFMRSEKKRG